MDATSGKVGPTKLAHNMNLATEVYIILSKVAGTCNVNVVCTLVRCLIV